jgi:hypothetical protein
MWLCYLGNITKPHSVQTSSEDRQLTKQVSTNSNVTKYLAIVADRQAQMGIWRCAWQRESKSILLSSSFHSCVFVSSYFIFILFIFELFIRLSCIRWSYVKLCLTADVEHFQQTLKGFVKVSDVNIPLCIMINWHYPQGKLFLMRYWAGCVCIAYYISGQGY